MLEEIYKKYVSISLDQAVLSAAWNIASMLVPGEILIHDVAALLFNKPWPI